MRHHSSKDTLVEDEKTTVWRAALGSSAEDGEQTMDFDYVGCVECTLFNFVGDVFQGVRVIKYKETPQ